MDLTNGIHHLAVLTADMNRLIGFYTRVFDAGVLLNMEEEGLRHAFIELGSTTVLHPFQIPGVDVPQDHVPMFTRGRMDHFALNSSSEDAFRELRRWVIAAGAGDGKRDRCGTHPQPHVHRSRWRGARGYMVQTRSST